VKVLEIRDLCIDFLTPRGRVHALRHASLAVPQGKIVGIVGESGSGKSTLVLAALALLPGNAEVVAGEVLFAGADLLQLPPTALRDLRGRRMAAVFQDPMSSLNPVLSIATQMLDIQYRERRVGRREKRRGRQRCCSVSASPTPRAGSTTTPTSSRAACVSASRSRWRCTGPDLLIADEPTTALDVTLEAQIIHLLGELRQDLAGSILFVSHNLGLIAELCDLVVVMYAGEVVEEAGVHELFQRPGHPYTQALLQCDPAGAASTGRELATIPGEVPDLLRPPPGCVIAPRCPHAFARCRAEPPGWTALAQGHRARCHLLNER
jgi:oligopeptide/dipeptide ABC transporter ATP-binding protein